MAMIGNGPEADSANSVANTLPQKKTRKRKPTLQRAHSKLGKGDVAGAMFMLESMIAKKSKRKPSRFNLFVKETMASMKGNGMSAKERMAECCRLWKIQQSDSSN